MSKSNLVQNLNNLKNLPKSWVVKPFKNVVSDNSGGNKKLAKSKFLEEGNIAVVDQGKELIAGYYNNIELAVKSRPPYIVFGDHTRAIKFIDFPFIMGADGTKVLQPKVVNCEIKYLYYFFLSINIPNTGYNRHFKYLKKLKIPLPPLETQKKIAAILDEADKLRQLDKQLIEKYDALTQSLFLDMFGDPVRNPKGWSKKPLHEMLIKVSKIGKDFSDNYIEYVDIGSINNQQNIITSTTRYLLNDRPSRAQQILEVNDIVFSTVRPNLRNIAINRVDGNIASTGFFVSRPKTNFLNYYFLFEVLKSESSTNYFVGITSGANYPAIKSSDMKNFEVVIPPIELQNQFAERVKAIEAQKALAQKSLEKSEELFNSLLQKAFKGELV